MGLKEAFAPEEWARIVGAPMLAGIAVTAADPGGVWGAVKESTALAGALQRAKVPGGNPLAAEIAAAYETSEGRDLPRASAFRTPRAKSRPPEVS